MQAKRSLIERMVMWWRGIVWQSQDKTATLYRSGWVIFTDGLSSDALPLELCSEPLVCQILVDLGLGSWQHCSPTLLQSGVNCDTTPRVPCQCGLNGSHDHFVATT